MHHTIIGVFPMLGSGAQRRSGIPPGRKADLFKEGSRVRVAVCDDEEKDLQEILQFLSEKPSLEISRFSLASDLLCEAGTTPFDLVILDIEMPGINGYEAALKLRSMPQKPLILFLTNSMDYTLRGYGVAFRYLTKPIQPELLGAALDSAIREIQADRFVFQIDGMNQVLPMDEIYYLEVFNHHTVLHTIDQSFTFRATLKEVVAQLPPFYFGMPHQSYIVNFHHIATYTASEIHLTNGSRIPVSRRRKAVFEHQFFQYLGR